MPIAPQTYRAKLKKRLDLNARFSEYHFELIEPPKLLFEPGQFISLQINSTTWRSYSITSRSHENHSFEILVDHQPAGIGTTWLKNLAIGQEITLVAPLGEMTLKNQLVSGFNFIGTGVGIAPLRSLINELLLTKKETRPIKLYWGMRYDHELFWLADWHALEKNFPNFIFTPVISRPSRDWSGAAGYVTDFIQDSTDLLTSNFYLCGSPTTVGSIRATLKKFGVADQKISFEQY